MSLHTAALLFFSLSGISLFTVSCRELFISCGLAPRVDSNAVFCSASSPERNKKQETRNKKQETRNKKQETRNKKQETRNKKQETRNKKQETRNKKQETRNKKQETRNKKQETRNKKQETRNKKQETRNKKQETRNKKQETRNKTQETRNKKPYIFKSHYLCVEAGFGWVAKLDQRARLLKRFRERPAREFTRYDTILRTRTRSSGAVVRGRPPGRRRRSSSPLVSPPALSQLVELGSWTRGRVGGVFGSELSHILNVAYAKKCNIRRGICDDGWHWDWDWPRGPEANLRKFTRLLSRAGRLAGFSCWRWLWRDFSRNYFVQLAIGLFLRGGDECAYFACEKGSCLGRNGLGTRN
ncbi:Av71 muscle cell intermediate filament [Culex quinquefasciatus]|uniref:Av71 muscle cell intermediate filament n=1 Tax=Culex quinquefasciatus TaxID=7176 RepID=B0XLK7_CULQU|nr:Av71 muscle cell intermediate filament [Culex quinquefasciatus]|eukprot:XP_001870529.1 Av71 muscle cell intermediate filament [Culex quinquefasciatus]